MVNHVKQFHIISINEINFADLSRSLFLYVNNIYNLNIF
jgi:hypothetical protein